MPKRIEHGQHFRESGDMKLAYNPEFRAMLREHPGTIEAAVRLTEQAEAEYNPSPISIETTEPCVEYRYDKTKNTYLPFNIKTGQPQEIRWKPGRNTFLKEGVPVFDEKTGLAVIVLGMCERNDPNGGPGLYDKTTYLKMDLDGQSYFVKKSLSTANPGAQEFYSSFQVCDLLKDQTDVSIVEAKLGFQDKHESWFVSKWIDLEQGGYAPADKILTLDYDDYGKRLYNPNPHKDDSIEVLEQEAQARGFTTGEDYRRFNSRKKELDKLFLKHNLRDARKNLFYNISTKHFILIDVQVGKQPRLN